MSWIERIKNDLVIRTGDGLEYRPNWINAVKTKDYNVSEFTFPNVSGTLVTRELPRGRKYGLEIYFQGENNIDDANAFEASADDPRAWEISHPYYDLLIVQPLSMQIDNTQHNVTKFQISVVETITENNPRTAQNATDKIIADQVIVSEELAQDFENNVKPDAEDVADMAEKNSLFYNIGKKIAKLNEDFQSYYNAFNKATAAINNAISEVGQAIRAVQTVINAPALFVQNIKQRIEAIEDQFSKLRDSVSNILNPNSSRIYENNAGSLISSFAVALVSNVEYQNRSEVLDYIDQLNAAYTVYLADLDSLQSDSNNSPDSYFPSYQSQKSLNDLINFTISNLFDIAINARQERFVILEKDDNIINLTHRFYGLNVDDSAIDEFVDSNNIGLNEMLGLKKGRTIVYYV
jgi:hypothetical protein